MAATAAMTETTGTCWRQTTRRTRETRRALTVRTSRLDTVIPDIAENDGETLPSQALARSYFAINDSRTSDHSTTWGSRLSWIALFCILHCFVSTPDFYGFGLETPAQKKRLRLPLLTKQWLTRRGILFYGEASAAYGIWPAHPIKRLIPWKHKKNAPKQVGQITGVPAEWMHHHFVSAAKVRIKIGTAMETAKDLRKIQEIGKLALKLIKQVGLSSRSMQIDLFAEWNIFI